MQSLKNYSIPLLLIFFVLGCAQQNQQPAETAEEIVQPDVNSQAVAVLHPTEDSDVSGTVTFTTVDEGVQVQGNFEGLSEGKHGFHIHQYGDCTADDATSAGGHYNPAGNEHGAPTDDNRHMGDMGNIVAGEGGTATIEYLDPEISLTGANSVIGRGVIVHGGEDDLESQPSGAAGPRMACGVIGLANTGGGM